MSSRAARLLATSLILAVVATASGGTESVEEFVRRHWRGPLAPQGPAPARFSLLEASLRPESCGTCHPAQYADWRTSWHAAATGPGVMGQLVEMFESDPTSALGCLGCHAPLSEQSPLIRSTRRFAREGVQCQDCHMPDRRHLWRGIRDVDMVRSGLSIEVAAPRSRAGAGDNVDVGLTVRSVRVGHAFPTYVTPKVVLRAELVDATGAVIEGSREERVIAREIALDLSREISDTP